MDDDIVLPTNTLIDTDPAYDDDDPEMAVGTRIVMKSIYLAHPVCDLMRSNGLSDKEIIDAFETLRKRGDITVCWHDDDTFTIRINRAEVAPIT